MPFCPSEITAESVWQARRKFIAAASLMLGGAALGFGARGTTADCALGRSPG